MVEPEYKFEAELARLSAESMATSMALQVLHRQLGADKEDATGNIADISELVSELQTQLFNAESEVRFLQELQSSRR